MTWLEDLKVGDKVGVCCPALGAAQDSYYVGVVTKVSKTKIDVQVIGTSRSFGRSTGTTKVYKVYKWDIPDRLMELTPEVIEKVTHRRVSSSVTKSLKELKLSALSLEQLRTLDEVLKNLVEIKDPRA